MPLKEACHWSLVSSSLLGENMLKRPRCPNNEIGLKQLASCSFLLVLGFTSQHSGPRDIQILLAGQASIQKSLDHWPQDLSGNLLVMALYRYGWEQLSHALGNSHPASQVGPTDRNHVNSPNRSFCFGSRYLGLVQNLGLLQKFLS